MFDLCSKYKIENISHRQCNISQFFHIVLKDDLGNLEFASNDEIELEADNILDFTENNPFGEF